MTAITPIASTTNTTFRGYRLALSSSLFLSFPFLSFLHQSRIPKRASERIQVRFAPTDYITGSEHLLSIFFPIPFVIFTFRSTTRKLCKQLFSAPAPQEERASSSFLHQALKQGSASSSFCTKHPRRNVQNSQVTDFQDTHMRDTIEIKLLYPQLYDTIAHDR
jgi:hypothetical protein